MAALHELPDGEARMLSALAAHSDRDGSSFASEETLARACGRKDRSARRLLAKLAARGLVDTEKRGRMTARRTLRDVVPVDQLALDLTATEVAASGPVLTGQPANRPTGQPANSCAPLTGHPGVPQKSAEENNNDENACASTLRTVIGILRTVVEGVEVYEASINSTLLRFPQPRGFDHEAAAHGVAAYVQQPGVRGPHNPIGLLSKEFEFQSRRLARDTAEDNGNAAAGPRLRALPGGRERVLADAPLEEIDEQAIYARSARAVAHVEQPWEDQAL